ncbi:hypothetical protein VN97_g1289 [Penicillium thymicola]|uniref:Uncharacterized protein n=1 Tax=Penicillium thymicola TaxID=293382 RepID=A0AAI9XCU7_PENTH|nr:hypothetical protein VN97_g1289 [Penicillium thymicola]
MVFPNQELWYASLWCGCSDAVPAGQWLRQHHGSQLGWQRKQNKSKRRIRNNEKETTLHYEYALGGVGYIGLQLLAGFKNKSCIVNNAYDCHGVSPQVMLLN